MARASETGFYFEPMSERLSLVIEGATFPTEEQWAYIGDPIDMTPELARFSVALRWPGIDPDALHVELDMGMDRLLAELEAQHAAESAAILPPPQLADVRSLVAQAEALQAAVADLNIGPITREQLEVQAEEAELARAAAAISGAARANRANRELEEERAGQDAPEMANPVKP